MGRVSKYWQVCVSGRFGWKSFDEKDDGVEVTNENFFCVVDLHAITMPHDPEELEESTLASAALYIAAGELF